MPMATILSISFFQWCMDDGMIIIQVELVFTRKASNAFKPVCYMLGFWLMIGVGWKGYHLVLLCCGIVAEIHIVALCCYKLQCSFRCIRVLCTDLQLAFTASYRLLFGIWLWYQQHGSHLRLLQHCADSLCHSVHHMLFPEPVLYLFCHSGCYIVVGSHWHLAGWAIIHSF